jgi:cell division protein FtsW (lipid II flippase)
MDSSGRTWILMLGVPAALALLWVYALLPLSPGSGTAVWAAALAAGLAGIATAPWRIWVKLAAAAVYAPAATLVFALFILSALCSAGRDCL